MMMLLFSPFATFSVRNISFMVSGSSFEAIAIYPYPQLVSEVIVFSLTERNDMGKKIRLKEALWFK